MNKSVQQTVEMIREAYGQDAMEESTIHRWQANFSGRITINDEPRSGRPSAGSGDAILTSFQSTQLQIKTAPAALIMHLQPSNYAYRCVMM